MTPATVVARVATRPPQQRSRAFEVAIAPDRSRVAGMRRTTTAFMRLWGVGATLAQDVVLAASELVTNAIEHGHGTVDMRMRQADSELRIEVGDDNPTPARLRAAGDHDVGGRGLFLVAVLARNWGVSDDGRTTWAIFRVPSGNR